MFASKPTIKQSDYTCVVVLQTIGEIIFLIAGRYFEWFKCCIKQFRNGAWKTFSGNMLYGIVIWIKEWLTAKTELTDLPYRINLIGIEFS